MICDAPLLLLRPVISRLRSWYVCPGQAGSSGEGQPGLPGAACRDGGSVGQLLVSSLLPGRQTETAGTGWQGGILYNLENSNNVIWHFCIIGACFWDWAGKFYFFWSASVSDPESHWRCSSCPLPLLSLLRCYICTKNVQRKKLKYFSGSCQQEATEPRTSRGHCRWSRTVKPVTPVRKCMAHEVFLLFLVFRELPPTSQETAAWRMLSWLRSSLTQR